MQQRVHACRRNNAQRKKKKDEIFLSLFDLLLLHTHRPCVMSLDPPHTQSSFPVLICTLTRKHLTQFPERRKKTTIIIIIINGSSRSESIARYIYNFAILRPGGLQGLFGRVVSRILFLPAGRYCSYTYIYIGIWCVCVYIYTCAPYTLLLEKRSTKDAMRERIPCCGSCAPVAADAGVCVHSRSLI